ncbi:MAG TPA: hypothetical protein VI389_00255, partial [Geobacteraceae bacterium]
MEKLKDNFKILGVEPEAPFDEIEAAYREKLVLWQSNLEKNAGKPHLLRKNEEEMQQVTEAFHAICSHFRDFGKPDFLAPKEVREEPPVEAAPGPAEAEEPAPEETTAESLPQEVEGRVFLV